MALIEMADIKAELRYPDDTQDADIRKAAVDVLALFESLTARKLAQQEITELYDVNQKRTHLFLNQWPIAEDPAPQFWYDVQWIWDEVCRISPDLYIVNNETGRVDFRQFFKIDWGRGVFFQSGYFHDWRRAFKAVYTAGYTDDTFPADMKRILCRQAAMWFKQSSGSRWDYVQQTLSAGAGQLTYRKLDRGLLEDFEALVARSRRIRLF